MARSKDLQSIRADPTHEIVGADAGEGTEECIASIHETLGLFIAEFGLKQPSVLKIRAHYLHCVFYSL